ncbi:MAG: hypothetical protein Faunusvirus46_4 [Faunusvirus sp.]|jgi:hypothetical protein|uniref:Uncharacterized protein n=1 Tax=Faunusvirus sp. TaxID=2487766 RepID=A0A3G5A1L5_9VIRU|nr:MAG: hypothetical protein Faunusvirus46_4 [Faunusvirus sp.]
MYRTALDSVDLETRQMINDVYESNKDDTAADIRNILLQYTDKLDGYEYVPVTKLSTKMCGGYIYYYSIDKQKLYNGGFLISINGLPEHKNKYIYPDYVPKISYSKLKLTLLNNGKSYRAIDAKLHYIFYKKRETKDDKFKKLFTTVTEME